MTTREYLLPLLAFLSLAAVPCLAQTEKAGETRSNMYAEDIPPWKEQGTSLPPYPKPDDLVVLDSSYFDGSFEYLIDTATLVVGSDKIARYSMVIRKPGSTRQHVIHEGLRCANRSSRIYGMASGGILQAMESDWKAIPRDGPYVYRRALYEGIICSEEGGALDVKFIKARLSGDVDAGLPDRKNSFYTGRR